VAGVERVERLWDQFSVPLLPSSLVNFLPNLAITLLLGILIGAWAAPRLGLSRRATGAMWLAALLVPLAYTLSAAGSGNPTGCEMGLAPWESRSALLSRETRANIVMLMPAGAAALLFPSGPRRLAALGAALALPAAIEVTQMVVQPLGRACQGADVFNNTLGVLLGFWLAAGVWVLLLAWSGNAGRHAAPNATPPSPSVPLPRRRDTGATPHVEAPVGSAGPAPADVDLTGARPAPPVTRDILGARDSANRGAR
jgi:hypothetical protein